MHDHGCGVAVGAVEAEAGGELGEDLELGDALWVECSEGGGEGSQQDDLTEWMVCHVGKGIHRSKDGLDGVDGYKHTIEKRIGALDGLGHEGSIAAHT